MARLERIDLEMQKARERIAQWQNKLKELDNQRTEQENLEIIHAVRALNMTRDELAAFLSGGTLPIAMQSEAAVPAARYSRKKQDDSAAVGDAISDGDLGTDESNNETGFETGSEDKNDEE